MTTAKANPQLPPSRLPQEEQGGHAKPHPCGPAPAGGQQRQASHRQAKGGRTCPKLKSAPPERPGHVAQAASAVRPVHGTQPAPGRPCHGHRRSQEDAVGAGVEVCPGQGILVMVRLCQPQQLPPARKGFIRARRQQAACPCPLPGRAA